ncbi:MAG: hypothetical protein IJB70_08795 [Clostridia bacterium]|nr:hypothetical protein [Clostridia bacterium]
MSIKKWHICGFVFIVVMGTLLHFAYDISGECRFVGYVATVNESVWEHLKLIFWPGFIFSFAEYLSYGKKENDFYMVKLVSIFCSMAFVVMGFYTYSGILGFNLMTIDVLIFIMGVFVCQLLSYKLFAAKSSNDKSDNFRGFVLLVFIALCFVMWTYNPLELGIFWG